MDAGGVIFECWVYSCIIRWPIDFSFWESCYARHPPTPRKIFTKNVRCAAQKQETVNISSITKRPYFDSSSPHGSYHSNMPVQIRAPRYYCMHGFHKLVPQSQHFTLRRQLLQWKLFPPCWKIQLKLVAVDLLAGWPAIILYQYQFDHW